MNYDFLESYLFYIIYESVFHFYLKYKTMYFHKIQFAKKFKIILKTSLVKISLVRHSSKRFDKSDFTSNRFSLSKWMNTLNVSTSFRVYPNFSTIN